MENHRTELNETVEEGRTVEEAVEKALSKFGLTIDQVDVQILDEGSKGVLGIVGTKQARVVVRKKSAADEVQRTIEALASGLMKLMDVSVQINVKVENGIHSLTIDTAGVDGLLIGRKAQTLEALEYLLRRMVSKQIKRSVRMQVDVGGYKKRRNASLRKRALAIAEKVKQSNKEMQLEPLSASERRIVHLALVNDPMVKTYTVGDGDLKNVVIAPQRKGKSNNQRAK
ncbi:MAG: RNA-binding cell elongation regulator Jag/EloR [bacterium]